jgi:Family of unknown function (DUF6491)
MDRFKEHRMRTFAGLWVSIAALGLTSGCATAALSSPSPTLQTFLQYAGPPIDSFTYLGHYDGFRTLGGRDLVIWTSINDAYLIRVMAPCIELPFGNAVKLTSSVKTVTRSVDAVLVGGDRCRIESIRHVDYLAMKQAHIAGP